MKKALIKGAKLLAINIAILIGSTIILYLFSIAIGITISNAIFKDTYTSIYAVNVFIRICFSAISILIICISHVKNSDARREFLNVLGSQKYDRKEDIKALIKTKEFYVECAVLVVVNVIMFFLKNPPALIFIIGQLILPFSLWQDVGILLMRNPPQWIFLVAILAFPFVNLWHHTAVRKKWASERLHFGNSSTANNEN